MARFASYKLLELAVPALFAETEEFCHTAYLVTGRGDAVVFLAHNEPTLDRVAEIRPVLEEEIGAATVVLSTAGGKTAAGEGVVELPDMPVEIAPLLLAHGASHLVRTLAGSWGIRRRHGRWL